MIQIQAIERSTDARVRREVVGWIIGDDLTLTGIEVRIEVRSVYAQ